MGTKNRGACLAEPTKETLEKLTLRLDLAQPNSSLSINTNITKPMPELQHL